MSVKLLTEHHLVFLSLKGGCRGSSESTLVKMPHCWKLHVTAQLCCSHAAKSGFLATRPIFSKHPLQALRLYIFMANNFGGKTDQNAGNMDLALTLCILGIFQDEFFSKLFLSLQNIL